MDIMERLSERRKRCKGNARMALWRDLTDAIDTITRLRSLLRQIACSTDAEHGRKLARQEVGLGDRE